MPLLGPTSTQAQLLQGPTLPRAQLSQRKPNYQQVGPTASHAQLPHLSSNCPNAQLLLRPNSLP